MDGPRDAGTQPNDCVPRHILLATDLSSISALATQYATRLAQQSAARLTAVYVFNPLRMDARDSSGAIVSPEHLRVRYQRRLDALLENLSLHVPLAEAILLDGEPAATVIQMADRSDIDLIVTGTHSGRALDRLLLGSTAEAIVRKSPCPVMTVGPNVTVGTEGDQPFSRIICAMDFGDAAQSAAPVALKLAHQSGAELRFLHVLPSTLYGGERKPIVEELFNHAMHHLVASTNLEAKVDCAVQYGTRISSTILDEALLRRADLIVLGVRRRSLLVSHMPAGIAFQVIAESSCPVLTISD